jgi:hypothetical protein
MPRWEADYRDELAAGRPGLSSYLTLVHLPLLSRHLDD